MVPEVAKDIAKTIAAARFVVNADDIILGQLQQNSARKNSRNCLRPVWRWRQQRKEIEVICRQEGKSRRPDNDRTSRIQDRRSCSAEAGMAR